MSGSKVIQDEEQYEKARKAMLLIAGELDDPISDLTPDERARKHLIYDRTVELMLLYRRGQNVKEHPSYKRKYVLAGWAYQE